MKVNDFVIDDVSIEWWRIKKNEMRAECLSLWETYKDAIYHLWGSPADQDESVRRALVLTSMEGVVTDPIAPMVPALLPNVLNVKKLLEIECRPDQAETAENFMSSSTPPSRNGENTYFVKLLKVVLESKENEGWPPNDFFEGVEEPHEGVLDYFFILRSYFHVSFFHTVLLILSINK